MTSCHPPRPLPLFKNHMREKMERLFQHETISSGSGELEVIPSTITNTVNCQEYIVIHGPDIKRHGHVRMNATRPSDLLV